MKKMLIILLSVALSLSLCSMSTAADWDVYFDEGVNDSAADVCLTDDGGYIIAGGTSPILIMGLGPIDALAIRADADGNELWRRMLNTPDNPGVAKSVEQTTDGGFIIAGATSSDGLFSSDAWLIKLDGGGTLQWDRTFGVSFISEGAQCVQQTSDGGYIIVGVTQADAGGFGNVWLIKTSSNGNIQWDRTFGGSGGYSSEIGYSVRQTTDGGYIIAGSREIWRDMINEQDLWLIKTSSNGTTEWARTFGGWYDDLGSDVEQTSDGGYIVCGSTRSYGAGNDDAWLIKTDSEGEKQWERTFGGANSDQANTVQQTSDGGYIVAGSTHSFVEAGDLGDGWLIKVDADGNEEWNYQFDSDMSIGESFCGAQQTADGKYIAAGSATIYINDPFDANADIWLVKVGACQNFYRDSDGDHYGDSSDSVCLELPSAPYTASADGDCDDFDPNVNPGMVEELCNDIDDDCSDLTVDDKNSDDDPVSFCGGDCDDWNPDIYPGAVEIFCNDIDEDCDPATPDDPNADGDPATYCEGDCDDTDPGRYACNQEIVCNGIDEDCNEATPDDPNADGDPVTFCEGDCDDTNPANYPGNQEVCDDGIDNDCDGFVDTDDFDCPCPELTQISCLYPWNDAVVYETPVFTWNTNAGTACHSFAVDLSLRPSFSRYWSTYEHLHQPIRGDTWVMPQDLWDRVPSGRYIYWRVRGADIDHGLFTVTTSADVRRFYKW